MTGADILARAVELRAGGSPFALATVTWCSGPSSGKGGSRAIVLPDGTVEGWLGGACARPTVVNLALQSLQDGQPRLIVLGAPDNRPGVTAVPMSCSSEGAMEVYVEPLLPAPDVWVVGGSPAVSTLLAMLGALGWRAHQVGPELDLSGVGPRSAVVVATQGHYDEPALAAALGTPAAYVGLVASHKRAAAVLQWLRESGVDQDQLARIRAPAGIDLGHTEHEEIAVSLLAELVALKASRATSRIEVAPAPAQAVDPVCGMSVQVVENAPFVSDTGAAPVYFCSAGCQRAYLADPDRYAAATGGDR